MQFLSCRSASQKLHVETVDKNSKKKVLSLEKGSYHGELYNRPGHRARVVKLSTVQLCDSPNFFQRMFEIPIFGKIPIIFVEL